MYPSSPRLGPEDFPGVLGELKDEAAAYLEEKADPADIDDGIANIEAGVGDMDEELVDLGCVKSSHGEQMCLRWVCAFDRVEGAVWG